MKKWHAVVLLHAVCWVCYYNSIQCSYTFDDHLAIVGNADANPLTSSGGSGSLWLNDIWGKDLQATDSHRSYRPLLIVLFRFLRWMHDSPQFVRIVSVQLHAAVSCLVYCLGRGLWTAASTSTSTFTSTSTPASIPSSAKGAKLDQNEKLSAASARATDVSLGAALLFACHPVHVEAVTAVVNLAEAAHALFFLGVYSLYASATASASATAEIPWFRVFGAMALASFGILFKETAITVYGAVLAFSVFALLDIILLARVPVKVTQVKEEKSFFTWLHAHGPWIVSAIFFIVAYAVLRMLLLSPAGSLWEQWKGVSEFLSEARKSVYLEKSELIRKAENPFAFLPPGLPKVLSYMYLHFRYMWLLLWPTELSAEYAFDCIPSVSSAASPQFLAALCTYITVFALIIFSLVGTIKVRRSEKDGDFEHGVRPVALQFMQHALLLMIVPFVPASGLLLRLGTLLAERLLYVPSVGFCLLHALAVFTFVHGTKEMCESEVEKIPIDASSSAVITDNFIPSNFPSSPIFLTKKLRRWLYWAVISLVCGLYAWKTTQQNLVWKDDETLFKSSLKVCPRSAKNNLQVAKLFVNQGEYTAAMPYVTAAKTIDPEFCDVGYQEALIKVMHHHDIQGGMEAAAGNLGCAFTANASIDLLLKLFDIQLHHSPKDSAVLENHGDLLQGAHLPTLATQKYFAACTMALEQRRLVYAVQLALKLEDSHAAWAGDVSLFQTGKGESEHLSNYRERVQLLGGLVRLHLQSALEEGKVLSKDVPKGIKKELATDAKRMLLNVVIKNKDASNDDAGGNDAAQAVQALTSWLVPKAKKELASLRIQSFLSSSTNASKSDCLYNIVDYAHLLDTVHNSSNGGLEAIVSAYDRSSNRFQSANLWLGVGKSLLERGRPQLALQYFSHAQALIWERSGGRYTSHYCVSLYLLAQARMEHKEVSVSEYVGTAVAEEVAEMLLEMLTCNDRVDVKGKGKRNVKEKGVDADLQKMVSRALVQLKALLQVMPS